MWWQWRTLNALDGFSYIYDSIIVAILVKFSPPVIVKLSHGGFPGRQRRLRRLKSQVAVAQITRHFLLQRGALHGDDANERGNGEQDQTDRQSGARLPVRHWKRVARLHGSILPISVIANCYYADQSRC